MLFLEQIDSIIERYGIHPKGILHVGANIGEEAPIYQGWGVSNVVWIEPNEKLADILEARVLPLGHRVFRIAAGDENKTVTLHISNNAGQSSSVLELGTHKIAHPEVHYIEDVQVRMMRIADLFSPLVPDERYNLDNIDFLNLDIQGAEIMALRGMGDLLKQFKWIYTEVNKNEVYKGCATLTDMDLFMTANGFRRVELFNNGGFFDRLNWSDAIYTR